MRAILQAARTGRRGRAARGWAALAAALATVCAPGFSASGMMGPAEDLAEIIDAYWAFELAADPFMATSAGIDTFNDRVPSAAPAERRRIASVRAAFLNRVRAIDAAALTSGERVNADLLDFILRHDIALDAFRPELRPFIADSGFHSDIGYAVSATPFRNADDYRAYLNRLAAFPAYLDQNIANMREALSLGIAQPAAIMPGVLPSFAAQVSETAEAHPLYRPFLEMAPAVGARDRKALRQQAVRILNTAIIPAYARVDAFMREEYAPAAAPGVALSDAPGGVEHYKALVAYYTTLDDATPEAIHAIGLREVARIRKEMASVIRQSGFNGSFEAFQAFLREDPQFYAQSPEALLKEAAFLAKSIDGKLPAYFGKLPRQPYSVDPVPAELAPNYTTGRYSGAPASAPRGGQYWVNTYALDKRPLYELPALTLHEAVPGHHLQIALALEIDGAPAFRTQFYPHAFGEGWGLYAEKLGVEMNVYRTPYEHFGRLSYEMWRACRLVIDTGLHAKGWSRQQAIDYLAGNTALSLHNVETEVDRYIAWPGQALAYKMGELTIWELRRKAEKALGPKFDIRAFHDAVLTEGGLPLELLRARIDRFIAEERAR